MKHKALYKDFIQTVKEDLQQSIMAVHGLVRCGIYGSQAVNWSDTSEYHYHSKPHRTIPKLNDLINQNTIKAEFGKTDWIEAVWNKYFWY